jgi:hypothetical protein
MTPGSNATIDPRLIEGLTEDSQTQPQAGLPPAEDDSDDDNEASEKRRKLNLWKCKQCRDARKKVASKVFLEFFFTVAEGS